MYGGLPLLVHAALFLHRYGGTSALVQSQTSAHRALPCRSCVGVWQHDRVEIVPNEQGNRTTPSYVAFTDTERLVSWAFRASAYCLDTTAWA